MPNLSLPFEILAFLFSLLLLNRSIPVHFRWFTLYCFVVLLVEGTSLFIIEYKIVSTNHFIFYYALPVFNLFYLLTIKSFLSNKLLQRIILLIIISFFVFLLVIHETLGFNSASNYSLRIIVSYLLTTLACLLYFIELIQTNTVVIIMQEPPFFIVTGLFCFTILSSLVSTLSQFYSSPNIKMEDFKEYRKIFRETHSIANGILYTCFSIAFYKIWKQYKRVSKRQ